MKWGIIGRSPLAAPADTVKARRSMAPGEEETLGWRPSVGRAIPGRDLFRLERELGRGGFGEIWLARHHELNNLRAFKFCFKIDRLRTLKREYHLFRLMRKALGERHDIVQIYDLSLDQPPFYLEMEYMAGGDLATWSEKRGGVATVEISLRLELMAQMADGLAAAHSVGILHKDLKPGNVLIAEDADGAVQARLTDFGIGQVFDRGIAGPQQSILAGIDRWNHDYRRAGQRRHPGLPGAGIIHRSATKHPKRCLRFWGDSIPDCDG